MLTDTELAAWAQRCGIGGEALAIVRAIRSSPPRRRVRSGRRNVPGHYPSRKMGLSIQFESHTVELPFVYLLEHDPEVLEYWDQPAVPVKMVYPHRDGPEARRIGVLHTADYFVLTSAGAAWRECKSEHDLARLASMSPARYRLGERGWESPPGIAFAASYGLSYEVCSSAQLNHALVDNLRLLADYLREPTQVDTHVASAVVGVVRAKPGIDVGGLRAATGASADDVYSLIARGDVHVDLLRAVLGAGTGGAFASAEQAQAVLTAAPLRDLVRAPSDLELAPGDGVDWDGSRWEVINVGAGMVTLRHQSSTRSSVQRLALGELAALADRGALRADRHMTDVAQAEALLSASPEDLAVANRRWRAVAAVLDGRPPQEPVAPRTLARWTAAVRAAHATGLPGYDALLPRRRLGNRLPRLDPRVEDVIVKVIEETYSKPHAPSRRSTFGRVVAACHAAGLPVPSPKAVARRISRQGGHTLTVKRHGDRRGYAEEPFVEELSLSTPRHGRRPFEVAHIDHTQLDAEVLDSETGRPLGRPWLTILADANSRLPLSVWLAFDAPSYRACMMAIRICVARHRRLPDVLVVDGGREFRSEYFEKLLSRYGVTVKWRPAAKARFGSVLERLFGSANTQLVHQLAGNTKATRHVRQLTQQVDPRRLTSWPMGELYGLLCRWAYEAYPRLDHPALGTSPLESFHAGLERHGTRPQRQITYDSDFIFATLPTTAKGTAKVDSVRGVRINYAWYWVETFARPNVTGTSVPVRFDPFDARHAYAFVNGRWLECMSLELGGLGPLSTTEVLVASAELRQRRSNHAAGATWRAGQLGQFLASAEAEQLLAEQRRRDAATRIAVASSGTVLGAPAPKPADAAAEGVHETDARPPTSAEELAPTLYGSY